MTILSISAPKCNTFPLKRYLEPDQYLTGQEAFETYGRLVYQQRQRLDTKIYTDWAIRDGKGKEGAKVFCRGNFTPDGKFVGHKTKGSGNKRKGFGADRDLYSELRDYSERSGNGVWTFPGNQYHYATKEGHRPSNTFTTEFDVVSDNPEDWRVPFERLERLSELGAKPNIIVSSGGKCDGFAPHVTWFLTHTLTEDSQLYLGYLFTLLGADPAPSKNLCNQFRLPGFYRHSKGREQGLFKENHPEPINPRDLMVAVQTVLTERGIEWLSPADWKAEREQKAIINVPFEAGDYDGSAFEGLLQWVSQNAPPYEKGAGSPFGYEWRRKLASSFVQIIGIEKTQEYGSALFQGCSFTWHRLRNGCPIGTIVNAIRALVGDSNWQLPPDCQGPARPGKVSGFLKKIERALTGKRKLGGGIPQTDQVIEFDGHHAPEVLKQIKRLKAQGIEHPVIHVVTQTGGAKSHEVTQIAPLEGGKILYLASNHRSTGLPSHVIEGYTDLIPGNEHGFYQDGDRFPMAKHDTPKPDRISMGGRCVQASKIHALREKGHDDLSPCGSCWAKKTCETDPDFFKYGARETWKNPRIRMAIQSLNPEDVGTLGIVILDELTSASSIKTIEASTKDLEAQFKKVRWSSDIDPATKDKLHHLEDRVIELAKSPYIPQGEGLTPEQLAAKQRAKYGYSQADLIQELSGLIAEFSEYELMKIECALMPGPGIFKSRGYNDIDNPKYYEGMTQRQAKDYKRRLIATNKAMSAGDKIEELPANILPLLLRSFSDPTIQIHLGRKVGGGDAPITATIRSRKMEQVIPRAYATVILDATATADDIELHTGHRPHVILKKRVNKAGNQTIRLWRLSGYGTTKPTPEAIERLKKATQKLEEQAGSFIPRIGHKATTKDLGLSGHWGRDNRATNRFAGESRLISYGLPYLNIGGIKAEYLALGGKPDGFEGYYQRKVNAEILQWGGRHRSDRYPDQEFITDMFVPPDADLSWLKDWGYKLEDRDIAELDLSLADRSKAATIEALKGIYRSLMAHCQTTGKAVADTLGKSRQAITKTLARCGLTISAAVDLIKKQLACTDNPTLVDPLTLGCQNDCIDELLIKAFGDILGFSGPEIIETVVNYVGAGGIEGLDQWMESFPPVLKGKIWSVLLPFLWEDPPPETA